MPFGAEEMRLGSFGALGFKEVAKGLVERLRALHPFSVRRVGDDLGWGLYWKIGADVFAAEINCLIKSRRFQVLLAHLVGFGVFIGAENAPWFERDDCGVGFIFFLFPGLLRKEGVMKKSPVFAEVAGRGFGREACGFDEEGSAAAEGVAEDLVWRERGELQNSGGECLLQGSDACACAPATLLEGGS